MDIFGAFSQNKTTVIDGIADDGYGHVDLGRHMKLVDDCLDIARDLYHFHGASKAL